MKQRIGYCAWCHEQIDPKRLANKPNQRFCSREHAALSRAVAGDYHRMGALGNASLAEYKKQHGHIPRYHERSAAVAQSNHEQPRRRKKT